MIFEFDTEQVPDYYLITFQEGTFDSPTGVSESFKFYSPDKTVEFSNQTPMNKNTSYFVTVQAVVKSPSIMSDATHLDFTTPP